MKAMGNFFNFLLKKTSFVSLLKTSKTKYKVTKSPLNIHGDQQSLENHFENSFGKN